MIALILGGAYVAVLATKAALALQYVARERGHAPPACAALPEATIVQPVLSGDPQLETTLERNVVLLDTARFVWAIDEDDAAGRAAAAAIVARHPGATSPYCSRPSRRPNRIPSSSNSRARAVRLRPKRSSCSTTTRS